MGRELGPITVLVNNAAHDQRHDWREVTVDYWEDRLQVNLRHQFFAIQAAAPMMQRAGGGSIVNFGSISWRLGQGGMPAYTSAKAAIEGLTRSFARDLGARQYPRQLRHSRLDHDRAAEGAVADAGRRGATLEAQA